MISDPAARPALAAVLACAFAATPAAAPAQEFRAPLSPSPAKPNACAYGEWSPPEEVPGVPYGVAAMSPSLALAASGGFVVANDVFGDREEPIPPQPLVAFTLDGRDVGKPPGAFQFSYPQAVADARGRLHVVWGESDVRPLRRRDWGDQWGKATALWYAVLDPVQGWSAPREIYRGSRVGWGEGLAGAALGDDGVHLAFSKGEFAENRLVHLRIRPGRVDAVEIPAVERARYASVALGTRGEVYVAYIGPAPERYRDPGQRVRRDANSVFLARSRDGGRTWLPPMLISLSGRMQATDTRALAGGDGSVHLVWGQNRSGGTAAEVLRHTVSRDRGETWSAPQDVDGPDFFYNSLRVALDGCGGVHAVLESWEGAPTELDPFAIRGEIWYARWNGGWSALRNPFPALSSFSPDITATAAGGVALFWSARPATDARRLKTIRPMLSRLTVRSASTPSSSTRARGKP